MRGLTDARSGRPRLGRRLHAAVFDWLTVVAVLGAGSAAVATGRVLSDGFAGLSSSRIGAQVVVAAFVTVPAVLVLARGEADGAGWGKRRTGLRVVDRAGSPPGPARAGVRNAGKLLPWELAHTAVWSFAFADTGAGTAFLIAAYTAAGLYLLSAVCLPDGRAPYDLLAGTRVVSVRGEP